MSACDRLVHALRRVAGDGAELQPFTDEGEGLLISSAPLLLRRARIQLQSEVPLHLLNDPVTAGKHREVGLNLLDGERPFPGVGHQIKVLAEQQREQVEPKARGRQAGLQRLPFPRIIEKFILQRLGGAINAPVAASQPEGWGEWGQRQGSDLMSF